MIRCTCYLLLATCYLLPAICYLLPATRYRFLTKAKECDRIPKSKSAHKRAMMKFCVRENIREPNMKGRRSLTSAA